MSTLIYFTITALSFIHYMSDKLLFFSGSPVYLFYVQMDRWFNWGWGWAGMGAGGWRKQRRPKLKIRDKHRERDSSVSRIRWCCVTAV